MGQKNSTGQKTSPTNNIAQRAPQQTSFPPPAPPSSRSEVAARRESLRRQMSDCAKAIELRSIKVGRITANPNWRKPGQLEQTLPTIRDAVYGTDNSLHDLIDATARISLQRNDPAFQGKPQESTINTY